MRPKNFRGIEHLESFHQDASKRIDDLEYVLTSLRFEGKIGTGKNLKSAKAIAHFFQKDILGHMRAEEEALFPFLEKSVPRLEPLLYIFSSEHTNFKTTLKEFIRLLNVISSGKEARHSGLLCEKLSQTGIFLIYLLRSHFRAENESIYKIAAKELGPNEKKKLRQALQLKR